MAAIAIGLLLTRSRSTSDRHQNISKPEAIVPPRMKPNADGQCGKDVCPKLPSVQDKIPEEKHVVDRQRIIKDVDPNLPGIQDRIPKDMRLDARLFCVWVDSKDSLIREMKRKENFENDCLINEEAKTRCFLDCTSSESAKDECIEKYGLVPQF